MWSSQWGLETHTENLGDKKDTNSAKVESILPYTKLGTFQARACTIHEFLSCGIPDSRNRKRQRLPALSKLGTPDR